MREVLSRLRAALTPQALLLLAALFLLAFGFLGRDADYASSLERRIAQTLSAVEGAGRVRVVIRTKTMNSSSSTLSSSKAQTIVSGAVAVAPGAGNPIVRMELQEALCALLDLPPSAVSVMTGGE